MENKYYSILVLGFYIGFSNLLFSQESKDTDPSFEEYKALRKKERETREAKEKDQEYKDYLEFQEYKKKKSEESTEEQELEKKKKEGKVAYSPWAVQYSATSGLVRGSKPGNGTVSQFLVVAEYHIPESKLGYRLGLSSWEYTYKNKAQRFERDLIATAFLAQGNLYPVLLEPLFFEKAKISGYSLDLIVDYHFNPRKFVDPYLFSGLGVGVCAHECNAFKILAGGGVRINIKEGYFLSELIVEKPFFAVSPADQNLSIPNIYIGGFRIGFGVFM